MEETKDQFQSILNQANNVLVCAAGDNILPALAAALGLCRSLRAQNKKSTLYCAKKIPEQLSFLRFDEFYTPEVIINRDCVITINKNARPVEKIKYAEQDDLLKIIITPKKDTMLNSNDLAVSQNSYPYDAIILVGADSPQDLGEFYTQNQSFFQEAPLFVIKNDASSPAAEQVTRLLKENNETLITKDAATALLAGIICETRNFQAQDITPQTLFAAAYLIAKEADQQIIIRALYKSKPLELITLWGRAMARFRYDNNISLGYTHLNSEDFQKTDAQPSVLPRLIEEIRDNFAQAEFILVGWENEHKKGALLHAAEAERLAPIAETLGGTQKRNYLLLPLPPGEPREATQQLLTQLQGLLV